MPAGNWPTSFLRSPHFGDDRCRIAPERLEKDIYVKTHLHTAPIVVKITGTTRNKQKLKLWPRSKVIKHTLNITRAMENGCVCPVSSS